MKQNTGLFVGIAIVVVVAGAVLAANGSKKSTPSTSKASTASSSTSSSSNDSAVATTAVAIKDYMFTPMVIKVKVGTAVTWTNQDSVHHTVTADTKSADAPDGPLFGQGETYKFTFNKAGTYTFHCNPHPYMHGTVVVTN